MKRFCLNAATWKSCGWFIGIYLASVLALGVASFVLKYLWRILLG